MCGIAGLYERGGRVDLGRLQHMSALMRHRGPDDEGMVLCSTRGGRWLTLGGADTPADVFTSGLPFAPGRSSGSQRDADYEVGLAHRRLSILDLKPTGHQPMSDPGGRDWVIFNGEIYNFVELKAELEAAGERFVGTSDTEVILAAYRRHGRDCLSRLNGMFGIAIWDGARRELFCARDRLGVKPFYYQWDGRSFAFASEPRALALTQRHRIHPRLDAIRDLIALDWVDHGGGTFFEGIRQLPAGHWLAVGESGFEMRPWWSIDPERRASGSPADWEREFERLFTDAVRIRLRADVEVGSCLSGGTDSSAVVTTASQLAGRPLHAFSVAYDQGPSFDERHHMHAAAEASGALEHLVIPEGSDFWSVFDRLTDLQGEPTAGPGLYSQWKVMELAHENRLKVLLDGQGGDETLAGYFSYLPARLRDLLASGDLAGFARLWGPASGRVGAATALALTLEPWLPARLVGSLRRRFGQGKDRVLGKALRRLEDVPPPRPPAGWGSALTQALAFDTLTRRLPSLLRYEDRNSMAFSIETRLPFLDYRLVEFAFSLPDEQRLDGATTKAIMRRALADRIPRQVLERTDKMGFETPVDAWLRGRHGSEVRRRLLASGPLHQWLEPEILREEVEEYLAGRRAIGLQVWRWLSLESWARRFVAGDPRLIEREPEAVLHAGRHRGFEEVAHDLEREQISAYPEVETATA